jgi:hypothetical protein
MPNRHQQIQKARSDGVWSGFSICIAMKIWCPRGDLATYDTGPDLADRYLIVVRAGVDPL